jgi:hypothetical protein
MPLLGNLHASLMRSIDEFAGLVEVASPEATSPTLLARLTAASREGEAFTILLEAMGDAGVGIPVPTDISLGTYPQAISPGIFGDPWTVSLPDGTLDVTWGAGIPIMGAIDGFLSVYGTFKELKNGLSSVANYIQLTTIQNLIENAWKAIHHQFTAAVKQGMTSLLATMIAAMTAEMQGKEMTVEDYANAASANIDELLETANHTLHEQEESTSMADRMATGDLAELTRGGDATREALERQVGPVTGSGRVGDPWIPVNPLPPSHSEISKDHPPHDPSDHSHDHHGEHHYDEQEGALVDEHEAREMFGLEDHPPDLPHHEGGGMDQEAHGSPFFGISNALGREAMRHIYTEVDRMLAAIADRRPGQDRHLISEGAAARRESEMENQDHDAMLEQAQTQATSEATRARQQGFRHMQGDGDPMLEQHPALRSLVNLVDLFISHPDASTWWVTVVDNYVGEHAEEVHAHIRRRNSQGASNR